MQGPFYREYGRDATINFSLLEVDGVNLRKDAVVPVGDIFVMKDEAAEVAADNAAVDRGRTYSVVVSAAQMTGKRIELILEDQTPTKVYLDDTIIIETTDHPSAMHPNGVTDTGLCQAGSTASTAVLASTAPTVNDTLLGQIMHIYEGTGAGQSKPAISYDGPSKTVTISGTWATGGIPDTTTRYRLKPDAVTQIDVPTAAANASANAEELMAGHSTADSLAVHLKAIFADTDEMQPKLGTPAGASISADILALAAQLPATLTAGGNVKVSIEEIGLALTELTGIPAASPNMGDAIALIYMAIRNIRLTSAVDDKIHNDAGAVIGTAPASDVSGVFTKGKFV